MTSIEVLRQNRQRILALAQNHHIRNVRVFGSTARGEDRPNSDIDLLVEPNEECSLLDHVALWQDLEDLVGRRVDVVSERALHSLMRNRMPQEAVPL